MVSNSDNNTPRVTVGIITYNRRDYLQAALESVEVQGELVSEIIVVNDGSTDGTEQYLQTLCNPKLVVLNLEQNQGRPAARNKVVERMSGEYLLWLDDDDALVDGAVSSHLECLRQNPDADIIFGNLMICDESLQPERELRFKPVPTEAALFMMIFENVIPNGGTLVRKRAFETVGQYNADFKRAQDYEFWSRAALAKCTFAYHDDITYLYRFHANNLHNPEHVRPQSHYQCLIVDNILQSALVEEIFPVLNWQEAPQESMSQAMLILAKIFFDHGDDPRALECAQLSLEAKHTPDAVIVKGLILRAMGESSDAADTLAQFVKEAAPQYASMVVEVGAPRGSAAVAEEAAKKKK